MMAMEPARSNAFVSRARRSTLVMRRRTGTQSFVDFDYFCGPRLCGAALHAAPRPGHEVVQ